MPMSTLRKLAGLTVVGLLVPHFALAAPEKAAASAEPAAKAAPAPQAEAMPIGRGAGSLALPGGGQMRYATVAESLPVRDRQGKVTAQVFIVSYSADGAERSTRPVTFLFNGGPGAASAFLMLGAAGPEVLVTNADGTVPRPPARLEENPASWLAFTDLVFIDPVGTGFSRATGTEADADQPFWNVRGDIEALSEVVRLWLTRNGRWSSPKFLAGESYGGFRAVKLARALQGNEGVAVNGLILISPVLEFSLIDANDHTVLPWALRLPSMAAAAQAHGKAPAVERATVERFALTDYLLALSSLAGMDSGGTDAATRHVAELIGLPERIVRRHAGRVPRSVFAKELLRDEGRVLSVYDASVDGPDPDPDSPDTGSDPMLIGLVAPYATAFNAYARDELGYQSERPYRLLNGKVSREWDWDDGDGGPSRDAGVLEELESAMALSPSMHVLIAHGVYDLITPYFASIWLRDRLELPDALKAKVEVRVYEGGHMPYMRPTERAKLGHDVRALYESALAGS